MKEENRKVEVKGKIKRKRDIIENKKRRRKEKGRRK